MGGYHAVDRESGIGSFGAKEIKTTASYPEFHSDRSQYAHLEAFARLACGMAPWLELEGLVGEEEQLRVRYAGLMLEAIDAAVDLDSPDYMNFKTIGQPLVDAAF